MACDTHALADQVNVGVLPNAACSQHGNLETQELLKMYKERFKLLRRRVLRVRQVHTALVRLMVYKIEQISIAESISRRHWALRLREDDAADPGDGRVVATVLLRLRVARLIAFEL